MKISLYHIDAFTDKIFGGNFAAVCVMPEWLPDNTLQQIAKENNLSVTAFLVVKDEKYSIRWLTPEYELDICGHGSLSAGYVIFNFIDPQLQKVDLHSPHEVLPVTRNGDWITLSFPTKNIEPCALPLLVQGLGATPKAIYKHKTERCMAVFESEDEVRQLKPDMQVLKQLEHRGITITAPGMEVDFVSRTFYPQKTICEDPATGASHCLLAPYWSERLNKTELHAQQVSARGGEMICHHQGDRVLISGKAVVYLQGIISI